MILNKQLTAIWILVIWSCFVLGQSLFFKFQGHEETQIIFGTISGWMSGISLFAWLAPTFEQYGGITVGMVELIAVILLLIPKLRVFGAAIAVGVLSGAIFFHLFTPLGIVRVTNAAGDTDGGVLFFMAVSVWISGLIILILSALQRRKNS